VIDTLEAGRSVGVVVFSLTSVCVCKWNHEAKTDFFAGGGKLAHFDVRPDAFGHIVVVEAVIPTGIGRDQSTVVFVLAFIAIARAVCRAADEDHTVDSVTIGVP
jgi:hypothetical protein